MPLANTVHDFAAALSETRLRHAKEMHRLTVLVEPHRVATELLTAWRLGDRDRSGHIWLGADVPSMHLTLDLTETETLSDVGIFVERARRELRAAFPLYWHGDWSPVAIEDRKDQTRRVSSLVVSPTVNAADWYDNGALVWLNLTSKRWVFR